MEIARLNQINQEKNDIWEFYYQLVEIIPKCSPSRFQHYKNLIYDQVNHYYIQIKDDFERLIGLDETLKEKLIQIEPSITNIHEYSLPFRILNVFSDLDYYFDCQWLELTEQIGVNHFQSMCRLRQKANNWIKHFDNILLSKSYDGEWAKVIDTFARLKAKWTITSEEETIDDRAFTIFDIGNLDTKLPIFEAIHCYIRDKFPSGNYGILNYNCFLIGVEQNEEETQYIYEVYDFNSDRVIKIHNSGELNNDYQIPMASKPKEIPLVERITKYSWFKPLNDWFQVNVINAIEKEKPRPKANKFLLYTGDRLFTQGNFKQNFSSEEYIPNSETYFHLEKIDDTKYKITKKVFEDYRLVQLKEAYPRNERHLREIFPTEEEWSMAVGKAFCVGGIIEIDDNIPELIKNCDFESGFYNKFVEETNWCLISFETIDTLYKMFKDFYDEDKLTENIPIDVFGLTGKVKKEFIGTIKSYYYWAKQDEIFANALAYFLANSICSFRYNPKFESKD